MIYRVFGLILLIVSLSSCTSVLDPRVTPELASQQPKRVTLIATSSQHAAQSMIPSSPPAIPFQNPNRELSLPGACAPFRKQMNFWGCVIKFTATPTEVPANGTVTFSWEVTGTTKVGLELYHFQGVAAGKGFRSWEELPASGSLTVQLTDLNTGVYPLGLWADDPEAGGRIYRYIAYGCSAPFFSERSRLPTTLCQSGPAWSTHAVQQDFEHGSMIWLESEQAVYILFQHDSGAIPIEWTIPNISNFGNPVTPLSATVPLEKYQPINELGRIWQEYNLTQLLGWAVTPEQSFTTTAQRGSNVNLPLYFRLADNRLIYVVDSQEFSRMTSPFWGYPLP